MQDSHLKFQQSPGYSLVQSWLNDKGHHPFAFQEEAWTAISNGESGLVNAPTGCGKTFSVFIGSVIRFINEHPDHYATTTNNGLQLLWITPLRALAKDIARAMETALEELNISWKVGIRNGDTTTNERAKQKRKMPEVLIITPESLHLLLAQKNYPEHFISLKLIAIDEWHELLGSKRGVQVELALSRILGLHHQYPDRHSNINVWGISATIGNLDEAMAVLMACTGTNGTLVKAKLNKKINIIPIIPESIEKYPWAGHLGIKLVHRVIPIIEQYRTTLIFINTRGMTETWYQSILNAAPELAGAIALHHGSIEQELRLWVEESLHTGKLKAVVCTASLDLGVDFRPVDAVIQVGSPKGIARFLQRAGRSGHQPDATSNIYFLPTHSLELVEAEALKKAIEQDLIESREPMLLCFDVLAQYLCTLAVSDGFEPEQAYREIRQTYCYQQMTEEEWEALLFFLTVGGAALQQYDEFRKMEVNNGIYQITQRRMAMRHRMHIGTIVSDAMMKVRLMGGGYVGVIEEYFISKLQPGDVFTLAGRNLEFVMIKDMSVITRKSNASKSMVPSWMGGRMSFTSNLGRMLRSTLNEAVAITLGEPMPNPSNTLMELKPIFDLQESLSHIPKADELLIEHIETKDGFHLFVYPFEGRFVHEAMAAILAWRISQITPITFSFAMNDYGFELLSDQPIPVDDSNVYELFSPNDLLLHIQQSVNSMEMAKRKFRDIAVIGGLIFQGMPGEHLKTKHLQNSASLLFSVFTEYEPKNILLRQAYQEVFDQQMEEARLRNMLERIQQSKICIRFPTQLTPFCFPLKVDSLRENMSSEKLEDRVRRMQSQLEK